MASPCGNFQTYGPLDSPSMIGIPWVVPLPRFTVANEGFWEFPEPKNGKKLLVMTTGKGGQPKEDPTQKRSNILVFSFFFYPKFEPKTPRKTNEYPLKK